MARVLAISSQVAYGPVGLTALVPALQAAGHEVMAIPTVTLSNHPGHGKPAGYRTEPMQIEAMLAALAGLGALSPLDAVLTGYFVSAAQIEVVAQAVGELKRRLPALQVLVDPVIGDDGSLYVPADVAAAVRDRLVPLASIITPNAFELGWLTGRPVPDEAAALAAAQALAVRDVLATSIPAGDGHLATLLVAGGETYKSVSRMRAGVPNGTGDFLSGLYLAARVSLPPAKAFAAAMARLEQAIALSAGSPVLDVAGALRGREAPSKHPAP